MKAVRILAVLLVVALLGLAAWSFIGGNPPGPAAPAPATPPAVTPADFPVGRKPNTAVVILPSIDDRLFREPCNRVPGGGLYSLATILDESLDFGPVVGISMGDATVAEGQLGVDALRLIYGMSIPITRVRVVCPGEGELGQGVAYVRKELRGYAAGNQFDFVCGNITDPEGVSLMHGSVIAKVVADPPAEPVARTILFVSVAARSLQEALDARGSDVVVTSPADAIAAGLGEGRRMAADAGLEVDEYVLLVQGTVEETRDLLTPDAPFDFAVAARGPVLPDLEPSPDGAKVPVYYAGRGMRFSWQVLINESAPVTHSGHLVRLGELMEAKGSLFKTLIDDYARDLGPAEFRASVEEQKRPRARAGGFVGAGRCSACHVEEATAHDGSAHAHRIARPAPLAACVHCHVTGAAFAGGWRGPDDTSDLAAVSCEACHGPGGEHSDAPGAKPYGQFPLARCTQCHLPDHSPEFDARALWEQHGHGVPRRGR